MLVKNLGYVVQELIKYVNENEIKQEGSDGNTLMFK
jgi:hypothetical protein